MVGIISIERPLRSRVYSYREKNEEPRERMAMKPIELSSLMGIGKGLVGEISVRKKELQGRMMQYLLLVYMGEQLRQEGSMQRNEQMREHMQCLFPLLGRRSKSKYGINDFTNQQI